MNTFFLNHYSGESWDFSLELDDLRSTIGADVIVTRNLVLSVNSVSFLGLFSCIL